MALSQARIPVQFAGGVETKMDAKAIPPVRLRALENAVFSKAVSLSKRNGYESLGKAVLGSVTEYTNPRGLGVRGSELVLFTDGAAYSYVEGANAWSTIADGCMSLRQTDRALVKTASSQTGCDYAEASGIALVAWDDSRGGVYYAVVEAGGERTTIAPTQASSTGSLPRCVRSGDRLVLLWAEATLGQIKSIVVDPSAPHVAGSAHVVTDDAVVALPNFDAVYVPHDTDAGAAITWNAVTGVRVAWLTPQGTLGSPGSGWPGAYTETVASAPTAGPVVALYPSGTSWAVAWSSGADTNVIAVESDPTTIDPIAQLLAPSSIATALSSIERIALAVRGDGNNWIDVWIEHRVSPLRNSVVQHSVINSAGGGVSVSPSLYRGACLASAAWVDAPTGGTPRAYVNLLHPAALFSTYLTVRDDGVVVAQSIPTNAGEAPGHQLPRVTDTRDDRTFRWCAVFRGRVSINGSSSVGFHTTGSSSVNDVFADAGPRLVTLDFDADDAYQTATLGRTMYVGGAITMAYDGVGFVEANFAYAPDWETGATLHTNSNTAGGAITAGTRSYIAWYEAPLANGEVIRGPVSKPYTVTIAGPNDTTTISWPTMRIGAWGRGAREDCRLAVARTINGDATTYYRITSFDPSTAGDPNGYLANDQDANTVDVIDALSDTDLISHEPAYIVGGIPSNDPIATSGLIAEANGRLFVGDSSSGSRLYHSQERAEGFSVEFTPELRIEVPDATGDVTAIAALDGFKAIWTSVALYRVAGPGPLANPSAGGGWESPERVASDVGCTGQRTVAAIASGLVFNSSQGHQLLDRGWNVTYIGAPVERLNSQTYVRATAIQDATQVRILTSSGETLHFNTDPRIQQWSTFTNHAGLDAAIANGTYHYLRTDGRVFRETVGVYADDNLPIQMRIKTAHLRFESIRQGLQVIWHAQILGTWQSTHTLRVQWTTDYADENWSEPVDLDCSSMGGDEYGDGNYGDGNYGGDAPDAYQHIVHVGERGQAISFLFTFIEPAGSFGACAELTEMVLDGGVESKVNRVRSSRMG